MPYVNQGLDARAEIQPGGIADTLVYWPRVDGQSVTPITHSVTIHSPDGGLITMAEISSLAANKLFLTKEWTEAQFPLAEDYFALWNFAVAGAYYTDRQYFDVVKNKLPILIEHNDLLDVYPNLESHLRAIPEIGNTTERFIKRAWSKMLDRIRSGGNRPSLILDKARLVNPGIELTLHLVSEALSKVPDDKWETRAKMHKKNYDELFAGLGELKYDRNEDTLADSGETKRLNRRSFTV